MRPVVKDPVDLEALTSSAEAEVEEKWASALDVALKNKVCVNAPL